MGKNLVTVVKLLFVVNVLFALFNLVWLIGYHQPINFVGACANVAAAIFLLSIVKDG